MSRLSRHIGQGGVFELDGDEFNLLPLGIKHYKHFMNIAKGFSGAKDDKDMEGMFKNFTDDTMDSINTVVIDTLKLSLPDESDKDIEIFAGKHLMSLLPIITKINGIGTDKRKDKLASKIENMMAKHESNKQDSE